MSTGEALLTDVVSITVGGKSLLGGSVALISYSVLSNVAVIVALHFVEEDQSLLRVGLGD